MDLLKLLISKKRKFLNNLSYVIFVSLLPLNFLTMISLLFAFLFIYLNKFGTWGNALYIFNLNYGNKVDERECAHDDSITAIKYLKEKVGL